MASLETYKDKFAESGWRIFERAMVEARRREQNYVGTEHILYALAQERTEIFTSLLRSLAGSAEAFAMLVRLIEKRLDLCPRHEGAGLRLAAEVVVLFKRTLIRVRANGRQRIEATDLFITQLMDEQSLLRELLQLLADPQAESRFVRDLLAVMESAGAASRPSRQQTYQFLAGEMVRVRSGPFAAFTSAVETVDEDNSRLRVAVFILGREMPVELRFHDVEKIKLT